MINLDQVRTLEWKVKQAVQLIVHLRRENDTLRGRLSATEVRLQELESVLDTFKASQSEMESGILSALDELDHLEGTEPLPETEAPVVSPVDHSPVTEIVAADEPVAAADDIAVDASFDEEFAALAAAEAAALVDDLPLLEEGFVPTSVELEPEEAEPSRDEREPEQPGLGIF